MENDFFDKNCKYCSNGKGEKEPYPDLVTCEECPLKHQEQTGNTKQ